MNTDLTILTIPKILETFDKNTTLKANAILKDFSALTIDGKVIDVISGDGVLPGIVAVIIKPNDCPEHRIFEIRAEFSTLPEAAMYQQLIELKKGTILKVSGNIKFACAKSLTLGGCQIES